MGDKGFWAKISWRDYSKWKDNDQIMAKGREAWFGIP